MTPQPASDTPRPRARACLMATVAVVDVALALVLPQPLFILYCAWVTAGVGIVVRAGHEPANTRTCLQSVRLVLRANVWPLFCMRR